MVGADGAVADAVRAHAAFIAGETLATELTVVPAAEVTAAGRSRWATAARSASRSPRPSQNGERLVPAAPPFPPGGARR